MWTRLIALVIKELLTSFREPKARMALIVPPLLQLILFAFAATMEVSNVPIGVVNNDWGAASVQLISRFERASAFSEIRRYTGVKEAQAAIDAQEVMAVVHIGDDFSRALAAGASPSIEVLLDGRKSNSAQIVNNYIGLIVNQFSTDRRLGAEITLPSEVIDRSWYNANRDYRAAMAPILIATLPMALVMMIVGMSVAREQELGTFEQLLVSPLQPLEIVIGKAIPGLIIGLAQCAIMTAIIHVGFGIHATGSIVVLFSALTVFMIAITGIALFISSLVSNQQQAMMGIMVTMMPAMLLSGFTSPVQNMPDWLQPLAGINPLTHMLVIVRGVFLRDTPFSLVAEQIWPMAAVAIVTMTAAAWMFRRKVE
ncbi:MAG: ABC transporter permease [Ancalomicrobiaceae bacterium]|nr:ABC transporter permease [Ancalomicrobiaceae bacterium]